MAPILFLSLVVVVVAVALYRALRKKPSRLPYPPGPAPDPLIGNLRQIPKSYPWKAYAEWSKKYNSDIVSFEIFGKRMVVLNTPRAAADLLEKRGGIYSERDRNIMIQDLMGAGDDNIVFMEYNDTFRVHRKVINTALNITSARDYHPIQEKEAYALLERILDTPENWRNHLRRAAGSTILTMTYGHQVTTDDDYLVKLSEGAVACLRQAILPTAFLVNLLPALKNVPDWNWLPELGWKRYAREGRKLRTDLQELPFKEVKDKIAIGTASPSYTTRLLDAKETITGTDDVELVIKATAGVMYGAGSDTSATSVTNLLLALILHPAIQEKVHAELDTVIGNNRLLTFADQGILPYLEMCMSESVRWNPVVSLSVPHALVQDDVYNGMFLPKGSVVMPNLWAMLHDEEMYPDPFRFWPERFDGRFPNVRQPRTFAFGFNRRLCPGRHVALNSLFIQAANLLAVYRFSKPRDENGNEVEPYIDYSAGPPKPFRCTITPRSEAAVALIRSAAAAIAE